MPKVVIASGGRAVPAHPGIPPGTVRGRAWWVMARLGIRFHSASAAEAQRRTLAFFTDHLEGPRR